MQRNKIPIFPYFEGKLPDFSLTLQKVQNINHITQISTFAYVCLFS